jgi:gliding motility-associated-like protein
MIDEVNCEILNNQLVGNTIPTGEYQWFDPMSQLVGSTNSLSALDHGVYVYQVKDISTGCIGSDSIIVEDNVPYPMSRVLVPESLDCDSREVFLDGSNSFSGPNVVYSWTGPAGGIIDGSETNTATVNLSGNYKLTLLDTINNCTHESTGFVLEVYNAPISNIANPDEIDCTLKEIELDGTASQSVEALSYQWVYNSNFIGNAPIINVENSGTYSLIVSNENSDCSDTSSVDVVYNAPPIESVNLDISLPSCHGENDGIIVFETIDGGSPSYKYSIDGGLNFVSYNQFYNISAGPVDLLIEDRNGCQWDTSFVILNPIKLWLDIGEDQLLYMGDTLELEASINIPTDQVDTIIWYPSDIFECTGGGQCFEVFGRPLSSIYARATLIDLNGCIVKDKIKIEVDKESIAYVPNIFSPNGDNQNDKFKIYAGNTVKQIKHFSVYNRWGKTIYKSVNFLPNDPNYGWDGTLNGKPLGPDVFVYWAEVELVNGQKTIFKGEVTLIK